MVSRSENLDVAEIEVQEDFPSDLVLPDVNQTDVADGPAEEELNVLLEKAIAGDPRAMEDFVQTVRPKVLAKARSILGRGGALSDPEDILQDVLLRIVTTGSPFDRTRGSAKAYISTITQRVTIDHLRKMRCRQTLPLACAEDFDGQLSPEVDLMGEQKVTPSLADAVELEDEVVRARNVLARLTPAERELINAYVSAGSYRLAARRLGMPLGTFKSGLYRAKCCAEGISGDKS